MALPRSTRLRWIRSKTPETLEAFIEGLPVRVQIYSIYYARGKHYVYFVADELSKQSINIKSGDLD